MDALLRHLSHWLLRLLPPERQQQLLTTLHPFWQQLQPRLAQLRATLSGNTDSATDPAAVWHIADVFDFDHYVDADEQTLRDQPRQRKQLAQRDRTLYLEHIKPVVAATEHSLTHRRAALRHWLEMRRQNESPDLRELLPGAAFERSQRLLTLALALIGMIVGGSLASILLQYDGHTPVSITWYLFWLVFLQLLLVGGTATVWALRRARPMQKVAEDVSWLARALQPAFTRLAAWLQHQRLAHLPADIRNQAQASRGQFTAQVALYGRAAYLPLLIPIQALGIGFNLGAILITVLTELFSDLAFGWGTALNIDAQTVYHFTRFIALPWGWLFGEGTGYPSLAAIEGTRILLKNPLAWSSGEYLRAWRWFLIFAVISYGLMPRLLLLWLSIRTQAHTLANLPFTHQQTQALYARLLAPSLETATSGSGVGPAMPIPAALPVSSTTELQTSAPSFTSPATAAPSLAMNELTTAELTANETAAGELTATDFTANETAAVELIKTVPPPLAKAIAPPPLAKGGRGDLSTPSADAIIQPPAPGIAADACILLIHLDIADILTADDHTRLQQLLLQASGWRVVTTVTFGGNTAIADQAIALLETSRWESPPARVALLTDGSQPPITEHLRFLRRVRAAIGQQAALLLALTGDPDGDDPLPPVRPFDLIDWQRKIDQLGDPYLRLMPLLPDDNDETVGGAE
ncbi:DUF2868 domain-containing protein [Rhodoferax sp. 4810]|uniref:DUF2868 domain-containing protein n=1 Tax=Thiospirillum jenense TaxID=1653858 RepID=A0A839HFP5_9GAMM|nr:DUF2868 domain-containing protein [Thiospirillum jenense]MBB1073843.1 DUF2868 domain-containing protein [Rhodoferax jenense]MBB1125202.1 DUF2868 domain-containing protein [Thiospirillum jenense]